MTENKLIQRQYQLDYLRVFASIAIILLHVTAQNMPYCELAGTEWNIYNICNSASRWGVPVFVMMSGALFLPREISTKTLYKKYISRMAIAYVVWSAFYVIVDSVGNLIFKEGYQVNLIEFIGSFISFSFTSYIGLISPSIFLYNTFLDESYFYTPLLY